MQPKPTNPPLCSVNVVAQLKKTLSIASPSPCHCHCYGNSKRKSTVEAQSMVQVQNVERYRQPDNPITNLIQTYVVDFTNLCHFFFIGKRFVIISQNYVFLVQTYYCKTAPLVAYKIQPSMRICSSKLFGQLQPHPLFNIKYNQAKL